MSLVMNGRGPHVKGASPKTAKLAAGDALPRITVVTATLNQAPFLEECLCSVLDQGYPNLEYIVVDGGSTDGSVEIIRRYAQHLAYWVSEPDGGMASGLNKGFARATGDVMGWINSDDVLSPSSLRIVGEIFGQLGGRVQWLTGLPAGMLEDGRVIGVGSPRGYNRTLLKLGMYEGRKFGWVQQEGTFWSRRLWKLAGSHVDETIAALEDFELWVRFGALARLHTVPTVLGVFRHQPLQTSQRLGPAGQFSIIDTVQNRLPNRLLRRLFPVRPLRWLERQGLRLTHDFVRYDFEREGWVLQR